MVHEAEQQALYFTLNVSTLAQAAAAAGGIIITKGGSKMKLSNGDEVVIRDCEGKLCKTSASCSTRPPVTVRTGTSSTTSTSSRGPRSSRTSTSAPTTGASDPASRRTSPPAASVKHQHGRHRRPRSDGEDLPRLGPQRRYRARRVVQAVRPPGLSSSRWSLGRRHGRTLSSVMGRTKRCERTGLRQRIWKMTRWRSRQRRCTRVHCSRGLAKA